jgi:Na+/H+ antiporter family
VSIGSSWTVAGTIGIGLMGIAEKMDLDPAITAGAVISGAYFGDKSSPLSDTANLAGAAAGSNLYDHVRESLWTSVPSLVIALALFWSLGSAGDFDSSAVMVRIEAAFHPSLVHFLPLVLVLVLALLRWPPFVTVFLGALAGGLLALLIAPERVVALAGSGHSAGLLLLKGIWAALATGNVSATGEPAATNCCRAAHAMMRSAAFLAKSWSATWLTACLVVRSPHADQHDALADGHDVAALHARIAPILVAIAPPDLELVPGEQRVELVDRALDQRLRLACRPEHRIAGHAAIDPAGWIALKERVWDRAEDELALGKDLAHQRSHHVLGKVFHDDAAEQMARKRLSIEFVEPGAQQPDKGRADIVWRDAPIEHEGAALRGLIEDFGQEILDVIDLDVAVLHLEHEIGVIRTRFLHPDDVVEEEIVAVPRRQSLVRERWARHHYLAKLADLRMNAELHVQTSLGCDRSAPARALRHLIQT